MTSKLWTCGMALLLISVLPVFGQEQKTKIERDTTRSWEIGLDLLWLINKNQVPATSIFTRYNFVDKNQKKKALRLRLGIDSKSLLDSLDIVSKENFEVNKFSAYVRPGMEWQRPLKNQFEVYYGFDLSVAYNHLKDTHLDRVPPDLDLLLFQNKIKNWEYGAYGFIGMKYHITNKFLVSVESTVGLRYTSQKMTFIWGAFPNQPLPNIGGTGGRNTNTMMLTIQPITVLNLSYKF